MTAKFDAFKAALNALCIEHGVHLGGGGDYDYCSICVKGASDDSPAGLELDIIDDILPTPEERAAEESLQIEWRAQWAAKEAAIRADSQKRYDALLESKDYIALREAVEAHAKELRKQQIRVSTDPNDPAYIDDRPRKVWLSEVEIAGWITADEFRDCVITEERVMYGRVLIERLPAVIAEDHPETQ